LINEVLELVEIGISFFMRQRCAYYPIPKRLDHEQLLESRVDIAGAPEIGKTHLVVDFDFGVLMESESSHGG
jgi:hypothetical protein